MPSEIRRLIFNSEELIEAIQEYREISKAKLPPGMIVSCTPTSDPEVTVHLEIFDQRRDETSAVDLAPEVIAAALLHYCITHRIPMPRQAEKSIQVHGDEVTLSIRIKGRARAGGSG